MADMLKKVERRKRRFVKLSSPYSEYKGDCNLSKLYISEDRQKENFI